MDERDPFLSDRVPDEERQPDIPSEFYDAVLKMQRENYRVQHPWPEAKRFGCFEAWVDENLSLKWQRAVAALLAEEDQQWSVGATSYRKLELVRPFWNDEFARLCRTLDGIFPELPDELDEYPYHVAVIGRYGVSIVATEVSPAQFVRLHNAGFEVAVRRLQRPWGDEVESGLAPTDYLAVAIHWSSDKLAGAE